MRISNADIELAEQRVEQEKDRRVGRIRATLDVVGSPTCVACGDDIDPERIAALPSARRCITCEQRLERLKRRRA